MTAGRSVIVLVVAAVAVLFGVQLLQEATEYHGGAGQHDRTTVVFTVSERGNRHGDTFAAGALWHTCIATIGWDDQEDPTPQDNRPPRTYQAVLHPSLPADTRRRLRGCLEDLVLSHIQGTVISMDSGPA
ncbi:hypothetical protein MXD61_14410 [Frankia sp. AgPm24]|uniref:hypothetical protein n=1 Tax=Frankia sp. AgPm24 TaxID=631128 RepID=UPI00200C7103|nr:hypothetical protein [Frankia sp. AgPm24]MCK9923049.1 hypothetical protein [Frankia sp. AgPm24]